MQVAINNILMKRSVLTSLGFGGEENPKRVEAIVEKGDAVIIPAGVGHRLLEDLDGGFEMIGSYPTGRSWDMCYGRKGEEASVKTITGLNWFDKDPLYGDDGPAMQA